MDKLNKNRNVNLNVSRDWERNPEKVTNTDNKRKTGRSTKHRFDDFEFEFGNDMDNFTREYQESNFNREFNQTGNTNLECGNDNCLNNRNNKFD